MAGLTLTQALTMIRQGLAWRGTDKDAEITLMMTLVQYDELEKGVTLPWFLIEEGETLTGTANSGTLALPTGFIRSIDDGALWITTSDGIRRYLRKRSIDWIIENNQDATDGSIPTGDPLYYALLANSFYVVPVPTSAWTAYTSYYKHDDPMDALTQTGGTQNNWLINAPEMLISLAGMRMSEDLHYDEGVQKFQRRFDAAKARLFAEILQREEADNEFSMGNQA